MFRMFYEMFRELANCIFFYSALRWLSVVPANHCLFRTKSEGVMPNSCLKFSENDFSVL